MPASEIQSGVEDFVGECVTELRQQTAQLCDEMLKSMRGGKTDGVHQKTLNRLIKFIEDFQQLNFADDSEMESQLQRVRSELLTRSAEDYRSDPSATRSLETGLTHLRESCPRPGQSGCSRTRGNLRPDGQAQTATGRVIQPEPNPVWSLTPTLFGHRLKRVGASS